MHYNWNNLVTVTPAEVATLAQQINYEAVSQMIEGGIVIVEVEALARGSVREEARITPSDGKLLIPLHHNWSEDFCQRVVWEALVCLYIGRVKKGTPANMRILKVHVLAQAEILAARPPITFIELLSRCST